MQVNVEFSRHGYNGSKNARCKTIHFWHQYKNYSPISLSVPGATICKL